MPAAILGSIVVLALIVFGVTGMVRTVQANSRLATLSDLEARVTAAESKIKLLASQVSDLTTSRYGQAGQAERKAI